MGEDGLVERIIGFYVRGRPQMGWIDSMRMIK